jgi:hypothetical protein
MKISVEKIFLGGVSGPDVVEVKGARRWMGACQVVDDADDGWWGGWVQSAVKFHTAAAAVNIVGTASGIAIMIATVVDAVRTVVDAVERWQYSIVVWQQR